MQLGYSLVLLVAGLLTTESEASCRGQNAQPICCEGKQSHCYGYTLDYANSHIPLPGTLNRTDMQNLLMRSSSRVRMKRCYCDISCMLTKDCCPDYRVLCQKPVVNCEVASWSPWSECSNKCGLGVQKRTREVVKTPDNGGDQCPILVDERNCHGNDCGRRRVGRSNYVDENVFSNEMAKIVSIKGDAKELLQRHDIRHDIRKKLYYGRLYLENRTEVPDPEPFSELYVITSLSPGCKKLQQDGYRPPYFNWSDLRRRGGGGGDWVLRNRRELSSPSSVAVNSRVCVTCFPQFMRNELGYRCTGSRNLGPSNVRFRNLDQPDCFGTFKHMNLYKQVDKCPYNAPHFAFL